MAITGINNTVTTSTAELKTSTPGVTRKEQIKTGFNNVSDYSEYLQDKYSYMNSGTSKSSFWNSILKEADAQRIWSKEEMDQGVIINMLDAAKNK